MGFSFSALEELDQSTLILVAFLTFSTLRTRVVKCLMTYIAKILNFSVKLAIMMMISNHQSDF